MRMAEITSEAQLQSICNQFMRQRGIEFIHIEKGRTRNTTHRAGVPDCVIFGKNKTIFIELKTDSGKVSDEQNDYLTKMQKLGHECFIIRPRTIEMFYDIINELALDIKH